MSILVETYEKLVAEKEALLKSAEPLDVKKQKSLEVLRKAEAEYKSDCEAYSNVMGTRLYSVSCEIAAIARMLPNHIKAPAE